MSSEDRATRQSRSNRTRNQPRRKSENASSPELIFVPNKVPSDFAASDDRKTATTKRTPLGDGSLQRKSPGTNSQSRREQSIRISSRRWSIPEGVPNSSLLEHIATSRFFHHYVSPTRTFWRLDLDFTHAVIDGASRRAVLAEAIIAMGILTLPNKDRPAYAAARLRHTRALRFTNKALQNDEYAKSDEILMAVILLGLYETTPDATHSIMSWTSHLDGARYLLRLRGQTLLANGAAFRMFSILRQQILLNCFMSMHKVPQDLMELCQSMSKAQDGDEQAASQMMVLFARMCNLVASTKDPGALDVLRTITDATVLDKELTAWAIDPTNGLKISTQTAASPTCSYFDSYEIFSSIWAAEVWIIHRTARYGVNSLRLSLYSAMLARSAQRESTAPPVEESQEDDRGNDIDVHAKECSTVLEGLRASMCSTVPFLLQQHHDSPLPLRDLPLNLRTPTMNLLLFFTRMQDIEPKMREWAENLLLELRSEESVDKGAIWMNNPMTSSTMQQV